MSSPGFHGRAFAVGLAAAAALAGCSSAPLPADSNARLDPVAFFTGRSEGAGMLHSPFFRSRWINVQSLGRPMAGGGLLLTQRIEEQGKRPRTRVWTMRPVGPGRYTGTLTEAVGPVSLTVQGPRADIRYRMKDGLRVRQHLALQRDGRTLLNRLEVRKWGIRVVRVEETIRKRS